MHYQTDLTTAVQDAIKALLGSKTFELGELTYTAAAIAAGISVTYPKTGVSLSNDEAGQIPNVTLSYNGIALENTSKTSDFTLTGFTQTPKKSYCLVSSKVFTMSALVASCVKIVCSIYLFSCIIYTYPFPMKNTNVNIPISIQ